MPYGRSACRIVGEIEISVSDSRDENAQKKVFEKQ